MVHQVRSLSERNYPPQKFASYTSRIFIVNVHTTGIECSYIASERNQVSSIQNKKNPADSCFHTVLTNSYMGHWRVLTVQWLWSIICYFTIDITIIQVIEDKTCAILYVKEHLYFQSLNPQTKNIIS